MPSNNTSPVFFYTYLLQSMKDKKYYIGSTTDLRKRIEEHRKGYNISTQPRRPFTLIYYEACLDEHDAKQRETYLKSTSGRRFLAKRLRHFNANPVWHHVVR